MDYILGEGDVITITVYEHPDLRTTARISGDGMITMPLIDKVPAVDISVSLLAKNIETLLADGYIINPQVNVFIEEFRSRKATILGEISKPGLYELRGQTSLLELISKAGGLTEHSLERAIIHRNSSTSETQQTLTIDLRQLLQEGRSIKNITIKDGDNIFIPKKETFFVTGQVNKPALYNYETGLTVIHAITMAGGLTDKASARRIQIIRTQNGREQLLKGVRMDQAIQPNDVIVVPESYF